MFSLGNSTIFTIAATLAFLWFPGEPRETLGTFGTPLFEQQTTGSSNASFKQGNIASSEVHWQYPTTPVISLCCQPPSPLAYMSYSTYYYFLINLFLSYQDCPSDSRPAETGVGGFERPAATSADPEKQITAQLISRCGKSNAHSLLKSAADFSPNLI